MRLIQTRNVFLQTTTLSRLSVLYDGGWTFGEYGWLRGAVKGPLDFGFFLEDEDRGLDAGMGVEECRRRKVRRETAIPTGEYRILLTHSPKYAAHLGVDGKRLCVDGRMLLVSGVYAFDGVRIHPGTDEGDTEACLLPGTTRDVRRGLVLHSTAAYRWLDARVRECEKRGEGVKLTIQRDPTAWATAPWNPARV